MPTFHPWGRKVSAGASVRVSALLLFHSAPSSGVGSVVLLVVFFTDQRVGICKMSSIMFLDALAGALGGAHQFCCGICAKITFDFMGRRVEL